MAKKTNNQIALEVLLGKWGSGKTREKKLKEAGYDYNAVQKIVNDLMTKKDVDTVAHEVINGKWGSGETREKCLKVAGYDYDVVQNRVNEILHPPSKKTVDDLAFEVIIGDWGSGDDRKKRLEAAGYNYNAVQNRVNELLAQGFRTRRQAMQPWYDACDEQHDWSYNARYNWGKWDKTIKGSKEYGTCITYPSVVAMRTKMIKEGRYITSSGSDHDSQATLDEFWAYSMKTLATINSKYWRCVKYPNKTVAELVKEGKIKEGDIIGFMGHTTMYAGKDKNGNLLFNNAGHAAGIYGDKPGSNRAVLNQKCGYGSRKVYGVFSVNTFSVMTKCEGGVITRCDQYMAGQNVTITIKPAKGVVKSLKVDGKVVTAGTSYTFKAIDANHTIEAVCGGDDPEKKGYPGKFPEYRLVKTNAQVIADTIKWAKWTAGDNRFHYGVGDHAHHNGCYFCGTQKMKMNHGIKMPEFTYCCNPFVGAAFAHGGGDVEAYKLCHHCGSLDFGTGSGSYEKSKNYDNLGHPARSRLKAGDVLCNGHHVALYIGDGKIAEASGGDDNIPYSKGWNYSIRVRELTDENYKNFPRVYRYNGHVDCDRLICYGDVADRVGDMQAFLNWYGNYGLVVDCEFGDKTRAALLDFQTKEGLVADAICGKDTIARMKAIRK